MQDAGDATRDPDGIVVALSSIALGALTGAVVMTAGTLAVRSLIPERAGPESVGFLVLSGSVALGFAAAVGIAFGASGPVGNLWRRAVIGAIALFGAAFLSVLSLPLDMLAGRAGLAGWMVVLAGAGAWALRIRGQAG